MIRSANIEDSRSIAEIHVASWKHTYAGQVPDDFLEKLSVPAREALWREWLAKPELRALVFEEGGLVTGFTSFGSSRDETASPPRIGEVYTIYLRPDCQRRGLG